MDIKALPNCGSLTDPDRRTCDNERTARAMAIQKRVSDAQMLLTSVRFDTNMKAMADEEAHPKLIPLKPGASAKDNSDIGNVTLRRKDYASALLHLTAACDGGDGHGCNDLGIMYDQGLGVQQDTTRAAGLFEKGCEGKNSAGCMNAGLAEANIHRSNPDIQKEISYLRKGCEGFPDSEGWPAACEHWEALQPGADKQRVAAILLPNPDAALSWPEQKVMWDDPNAMGLLCEAHNMRACFDLTVLGSESLADHIAYLDRDSTGRDTPYTENNLRPIRSSMRALCTSPKDVPHRSNFCHIADEVDFAIAHNFGPKANDPARCLIDTPIYQNSQKVYTDSFGNKSYGSVEHNLSQVSVKNVCAYTVEFATVLDGLSDVKTLRPNESKEINGTMSGTSYIFIKKH